jgi:membrane-bound serine protease (ClpP class)
MSIVTFVVAMSFLPASGAVCDNLASGQRPAGTLSLRRTIRDMTALGLVLLVLGAVLLVVEAHTPTLGVLGGPGVIALGAGALLAVGGLGGGLAIGLVTAILLALGGVGVLAVTFRKGIAVRRRRVRAGPERLVGQLGVVRRWDEPRGKVLVDGALWQARRSWPEDEQPKLHEGDPIVVERLDGLTLAVRPAEEWELVR